MTEDLELTPRFRLIERLQLLEKAIKMMGSDIDRELTRAEASLRALHDVSRVSTRKEIKKLVKMGLLGKEKATGKKKRFMSPEARKRISDAKKAYWAKKRAGK